MKSVSLTFEFSGIISALTIQSYVISRIAAKVDTTQALTITAVKYRFFFFFSVINFIFKTLSSVPYFVDVYKHSKAELKISATKFREKSSIIFVV